MTLTDTIICCLGWACFVALVMDTPLYDKLVRILHMTHKPFTCPKCMGFWTSLPFFALSMTPMIAVMLAAITAALTHTVDDKINNIYG